MTKNITNYNNCPNCGAPIEHKYNHQCPYCKTMLDMKVRETKELNPRYMKNVRLVRLETIPELDETHFLFRGDYQYFPQILEYKEKTGAMIVNFDDIKPFEVSFCISINNIDLYRMRTENICNILAQYFPNELNMYSVIEAIRNSEYKYILGGY